MVRRVIEERIPEPDEPVPGHTHQSTVSQHQLTGSLLNMCVRPLVVMETE